MTDFSKFDEAIARAERVCMEEPFKATRDAEILLVVQCLKGIRLLMERQEELVGTLRAMVQELQSLGGER